MKLSLTLVLLLFAACALANAQTAPAATSGGAILDLSFYFSETAMLRTTALGNQVRGVGSGDLDYANGNERLPFSVKFAGGYGWHEAGEPYGIGWFETLALKQSVYWRRTSLSFEDDEGDRPLSQTTGFSGVAGTGEPIGGSGNPTSDETVLTLDTRILTNTVKATVNRSLDYATNVNGSGSSEILRFNDGDGIDTDVDMANAGLTRRLNGRNTLTASYAFIYYNYPDSGGALGGDSFNSNTVLFGMERQWTRRWFTSGAIGPEWITGSESSVVPTARRISGTAEIDYKYRYDYGSVRYSHGSSSGSGYLLGAESDAIYANYSRDSGNIFTLGIEGSYRRLAGLVNNGITTSRTGAVESGWRLGRNFNLTASYTLLDQSSSSTLLPGALDSTIHVISAGVGYWPRGNRTSSLGNGP